jgi:rubrerythrin
MTFEEEVAARRAMVRATHPLMGKVPHPTRTLIPVEQAICQIQEAIDCYEEKLNRLYAEMRILRDEA